MKISICLLICFISCVSSSLHSICKNDTFEYNSNLINGFYRIQKQINYGPSESYIPSINFTENLNMEWREKIDLQVEVSKYITVDFLWFYNPLTTLFFNSTWLENEKKMFINRKEKIIMIKNKYNNENAKSIYDKILMTIDKPIKMIDELMPIANHILEEDLLSKEELKKYLNSKLIKLRVKKFPLEIESYFKYELVKLNKFTFDKNKNGLFVVDIFLPVVRRKFTTIPIIEKCVPVKNPKTGYINLPPFFQKVTIY